MERRQSQRGSVCVLGKVRKCRKGGNPAVLQGTSLLSLGCKWIIACWDSSLPQPILPLSVGSFLTGGLDTKVRAPAFCLFRRHAGRLSDSRASLPCCARKLCWSCLRRHAESVIDDARPEMNCPLLCKAWRWFTVLAVAGQTKSVVVSWRVKVVRKALPMLTAQMIAFSSKLGQNAVIHKYSEAKLMQQQWLQWLPLKGTGCTVTPCSKKTQFRTCTKHALGVQQQWH